MSGVVKLVILGVMAGGLVVAGFLLPIDEWAIEVIESIRDLGPVGWAVFIAVYIGATVSLIPASALTLGAGFAFGLAGAALVWPAAVIGATLSFAIGQKLGRSWVSEKISDTRRIKAIDEVVGDRGFKLTALLRLSPLFPFGLLNYGLSLTRVRFRDYVLGTAVGIVPGMFMYVYFGTTLGNLAQLAGDEAQDSTASRLAFWIGLGVTALVTVWVTWMARERVGKMLEQSDAGV